MKSTKQKQAAIGLALLTAIMGLIYLLLSWVWEVFSSVDPRLGAGLVAAAATVIVSLVSVLVSKHLERKAEISAQLREKKVPTYEKIIGFIFRITFAEKIEKPQPEEKEIIKFMAEITQELVVWGSDEILEEFHKFRKAGLNTSEENTQNPLEILFVVEDLLLAIRKDLGHKNRNIGRGKVLGLFVNDLPDLE